MCSTRPAQGILNATANHTRCKTRGGGEASRGRTASARHHPVWKPRAGTNRADGDYDLLVVSEQLLDYDEVYRPVAGRGLRCDVIPCTLDAWRAAHLDAGGVLRDALDEGIVLYGES